MKTFIASLALLFALPSYAATYYFSDCQSGAVSGCTAGSDSSATPTNSATPYRTLKKALEVFRIAAPGDKIRFAKGASFTLAEDMPIQNLDASAENPITFANYQPSWYSGSNKPKLAATANITLFSFTDGGSPEPDGGYVMRDLHLIGNAHLGYESVGIFTSQLTSDITLDNLTIDGFQLGLYCGDDIPRVTLKNSRLINNVGSGVLNSCDDVVIENNTFDNNGFGHAFRDHQIYLSGSISNGSSGVTIRNNTMTNSVHFEGTACTGVPLVGHGKISNLLIENNRIIETTQAGPGCWGIIIDGGYGPEEGVEGFANVTIRGNLLVNLGNIGIGCTSCQNWVIENNVLVWQHEIGDVHGISIPTRDLEDWDEDEPQGSVTVRNNSIYFKKPTGAPVGIRLSETGTGHIITSNLIFFGPDSSNQSQCFDTTNLRISHFTDVSTNLCYRAGGARFNERFATVQEAQASNPRWNLGGMTAGPQLAVTPGAANNYSLALKPTSPAIGAGNPIRCSPTDFEGEARVGQCDIGAYDQ